MGWQVAILVDDMIDTGSTLTLAARTLHENGAKDIYALVSHGLLSEVNMSLIEDLPIKLLVVSNFPLPPYLWFSGVR